MLTAISIALLLNGLTLTLASGLLLLILWHDPRRITNLYFAWFLLMMMIWSAGSLLGRTAAFAGANTSYVDLGVRLLEIGFTGSSLALYLYTVVLIGNRSRQFLLFGGLSILALLGYQMALVALGAESRYTITPDGILYYNFAPLSIGLFALLDIGTLVLVWQGFRKIQRPALIFGIMVFALGQLMAMASPRLQVLAIAEDAGAIATLIMVVTLLQSQIIQPLAGQTRQIEVVRDVGLAITSRLRLQHVLETIAAQAAALLRADASLIYLRREDYHELVLAAQYNIHQNVLGYRLKQHDGLVGKVALERRPQLLMSYSREWRGTPDAPFAEEGFGSVIAAPLIFGGTVVGVLLVIQGSESRIFELEDVQLLELLAPQAAVAITNSRLFEQERALTDKLETAKIQLEAFLSSTDNPMIALNKSLQIIFANQAAAYLLSGSRSANLSGQNLVDILPTYYLPKDFRRLIKSIHRKIAYVYELTINENIYLCHVARIDHPARGWVVVLNDVTSLKELDRLQRQMIELTTHQLKNPLTGAMLHLDELRDLSGDILDENIVYALDVIETQMERMQRIIEGILNLERLHSRSNSRSEQVDLTHILRDVYDTLGQYADNKGIRVDLNISQALPLVKGDPKELTEAISNLIDNAIKYSRDKGFVLVTARPEENSILISVKDNGIGIPLEAQSRVFERFYRVEQPGTEQISGTGIGLSYVKAIVESHRGRIWLESEVNRGTTFFVALPTLQTIEAQIA